MPEQDPMNDILKELAGFLDILHNHKDKKIEIDNPAEVEKQLDQFEQQLELFRATQMMMLRQAGVSDEQITAMTKKSADEYNEEDRKVLKKAETIKKNLLDLRKEYEKRSETERLQKRAAGKEGKAVGKSRKKKFKRLGSKKGWKPI